MRAVAMNHDEHSRRTAHSEKHKAIDAVVAVVRVVDQNGVLVVENRPGLLERYAVLSTVRCSFPGIPGEAQARHTDIVPTM